MRTLERVCIYLFKFAGLPKLREILLRKSNGEIDGSNAKKTGNGCLGNPLHLNLRHK